MRISAFLLIDGNVSSVERFPKGVFFKVKDSMIAAL